MLQTIKWNLLELGLCQTYKFGKQVIFVESHKHVNLSTCSATFLLCTVAL